MTESKILKTQLDHTDQKVSDQSNSIKEMQQSLIAILGAQIRLETRLLSIDKSLEVLDQDVKILREERLKLASLIEHKDWMNRMVLFVVAAGGALFGAGVQILLKAMG